MNPLAMIRHKHRLQMWLPNHLHSPCGSVVYVPQYCADIDCPRDFVRHDMRAMPSEQWSLLIHLFTAYLGGGQR